MGNRTTVRATGDWRGWDAGVRILAATALAAALAACGEGGSGGQAASPPVAEGWLAFLTAIRQKCELSGRIRELVIMRVAVLNGANYEFVAHTPFAKAEGITDAQIEALKTDRLEAFEPLERSVIAYCDAMTKDIQVPQAIFDAVKPHFDDRAMVELTATIAAYNLVSRFLEAVQVDHE